MIKYIKRIISSKSDVSHKRILALLSFIVLIGMVIGNVIFKIVVQESLIYTFAGICTGQSTLSVIDKFAKC